MDFQPFVSKIIMFLSGGCLFDFVGFAYLSPLLFRMRDTVASVAPASFAMVFIVGFSVGLTLISPM